MTFQKIVAFIIIAAASMSTPGNLFVTATPQQSIPAFSIKWNGILTTQARRQSKTPARSYSNLIMCQKPKPPFQCSEHSFSNTANKTTRRRISSTTVLEYSLNDNLVSGIAEVSIGLSLGVLFSEYAILTTGCGPASLSDSLERLCYQGTIIVAGAIIFTRITTGGKDLVLISEYVYGDLEEFTLLQVRWAER